MKNKISMRIAIIKRLCVNLNGQLIITTSLAYAYQKGALISVFHILYHCTSSEAEMKLFSVAVLLVSVFGEPAFANIVKNKSARAASTSLSCTGRCDESYNGGNKCQCNDRCREYGNCCDDYIPVCAATDSCQLRCSERHDSAQSCSCDDQCLTYNNCCDDYEAMCNPITTCKDRCDETSSPTGAICYCDAKCSQYKNCCDDFSDVCFRGESYLCKGECNVTRARCDCNPGCEAAKNCCSDYLKTCNGEPSWVEQPCSTEAEMKCPNGYEDPIVILFSIDGYKAEYLSETNSPNIWKLATCGVHTPYMRSVTPTSTFPNHYSMATGLYPESHGIVDNTMYDHEHEEKFSIGSPNSYHPFWWGGEPIWVTTSNQGLKSATYFWVGSDVNITRYPDYYYHFDGSVPNEERMYTALDWLDMSVPDRPSFVALYMDIVDHAGHSYGPDSPEVAAEVAEADRIVGILMDGLKLRGLENCVNVIMVADHGMTDISCDRKTSVEDYGVDLDLVFFKSGAFSHIGKSPDRTEWDQFDPQTTYDELRCKHNETHWLAYQKHGYLPKRYHYTNNDRIDDIVLAMDDRWISEGRKGSYTSCNGGTHGYDNEYRSMHALFAAHGVAFKRKYDTMLPFENIELYNLVTGLLNLDAAPNNGTEGSLNHILKNPTPISSQAETEVPNTCDYPAQDTSPSDMGCLYCSGIDEATANKRLQAMAGNQEAQQSNMPYGRPQATEIETDDVAYCLLTQEDYINAYDFKRKISRYVSFTMTDEARQLYKPKYCVRPDIRVPQEATTPCSDYTTTKLQSVVLYTPAFSNGQALFDATLTSNSVPMYISTYEIWTYMARVLTDWSQRYGGINVIAGPAFDSDFDGHPDSLETLQANGTFLNDDTTSTPIPTHFFLVVTRCVNYDTEKISSCVTSPTSLEVQAFIIPNFAEPPCNSMSNQPSDWVPKTLKEHVARLRDVEILTGLSFLPKWTHAQNVDQETRIEATRLRLRLPQFDSQWMNDFLTITPPPFAESSAVTTTEKTDETTSGTTKLTAKNLLYLVIISILWWLN